MNTVELHCIIHADKSDRQNIADILIAQLAELGYHGFQDTSEGLKAYINENDFNYEELRHLPIRYIHPETIELHHQIIEEKNWNEEWEKGFKPVKIGNEILIRAPFHGADSTYRYEIVIEPKMSFGTGHHSTTFLMLEWLLEIELSGQKVLDMGCGTGILSIMASKKGAREIWAADINEWAWHNTHENVKANNCSNIKIIKGSSRDINPCEFDVILANINLNVLLEDIPVYAGCLGEGGELILSGIYKSDIKKIREKAELYKFRFLSHREKNLWVAMRFEKMA